MRIVSTLAVASSLLVSAAAMAGTTKPKTMAKKAGNEMITCPIMHSKVPKSKAIKVAANGKTTYVCCKSCVAAAKKQLMAKK